MLGIAASAQGFFGAPRDKGVQALSHRAHGGGGGEQFSLIERKPSDNTSLSGCWASQKQSMQEDPRGCFWLSAPQPPNTPQRGKEGGDPGVGG